MRFRPAFKTIVKSEVTWTLQSRLSEDHLWSYVSNHGSEEAATLRAKKFLAGGSKHQFRVMQLVTEIKVTDVITAPEAQSDDRYAIREILRGLFVVVDTESGTDVISGCSRYGAQYLCDGLNQGLMQVDETGTVVSV